jgi:hypothetical protein
VALRRKLRDDLEREGEEFDRPLINLKALKAQHATGVGRRA